MTPFMFLFASSSSKPRDGLHSANLSVCRQNYYVSHNTPGLCLSSDPSPHAELLNVSLFFNLFFSDEEEAAAAGADWWNLLCGRDVTVPHAGGDAEDGS